MWTIKKKYDENLDIFTASDNRVFIKVAKVGNETGTTFKEGNNVVEGVAKNYKADGEIVLDVDFEESVVDDLGNVYCKLTGEDTKVLYVAIREG